MNETLAIDIKHLTKKFGKRTVVNNIALKVPRGKIYGFLGPNGSGKTTTIRLICGLLTPDFVDGNCLGYDVATQANLIRKKVGYMTQKFSFWEDLTIRENLEFTANIYGMDGVPARVDKALEKLGLTSRANQLAGTLSGGWKQRLALAACILHEPEILLLDEPTAGVDPKARREFWDELNHLSDEGLTVLVSTHYMDEAERCHELVYIAYGNVVVQGTLEFVVKNTRLRTFDICGNDVLALKSALAGTPEIVTMALFGEHLHICGNDAAAIENLLAAARERFDFSFAEIATSLEDAFIFYLKQSKEN